MRFKNILLTCIILALAVLIIIGFLTVEISLPFIFQPKQTQLLNEIPIYPKSIHTDSTSLNGLGASGGSIHVSRRFFTNDSPEKIIEFYRDELENSDWELLPSSESTRTTRFAEIKTEDKSYYLTIQRLENDSDYYKGVPYFILSIYQEM